MILTKYIVTIEIPDDFTLQRQDKALDTIDEINMGHRIQQHVEQLLSETRNLMEATAEVAF